MADTTGAAVPRAATPPAVETTGAAPAPATSDAAIGSQAHSTETKVETAETKVPSHSAAIASTNETAAASKDETTAVGHNVEPSPATKAEPAEPMSKVRALAPDSNRAKGALQQTIGSTKEALGELLHLEGLRKAGEEQRKEGEAREEAALRRDAGSGVTDAFESGLRKAVATLKGERKSSVDASGERRKSVTDTATTERKTSVTDASTAVQPNTLDAPGDATTRTGTGNVDQVARFDHAHDASATQPGVIASDPPASTGDSKIEPQPVTGDSHGQLGSAVETTLVERSGEAGGAHSVPGTGAGETPTVADPGIGDTLEKPVPGVAKETESSAVP